MVEKGPATLVWGPAEESGVERNLVEYLKMLVMQRWKLLEGSEEE